VPSFERGGLYTRAEPGAEGTLCGVQDVAQSRVKPIKNAFAGVYVRRQTVADGTL